MKPRRKAGFAASDGWSVRPENMKQQTEEQIRAINGAIEQASRELKRCKQACRSNGSPIRSITFRVMDDGNTKLHVTYKRK